RVTALPIRWNTGRQGAPRPDQANPVRGETNLFSAELWFMRDGAQSVEVEIFGGAGSGQVIVPVNAIATRMLEMPGNLGKVLGALGLLLFLLFVSIAGTAVRESILPPGRSPSSQRLWGSRVMMAAAALAFAALLWFGKTWWDSEANDYRSNRLYRPLETSATVHDDGPGRVLRLEVIDEKFGRTAPLVPDHGKLMHLFLIREPGLEFFAHLHPSKRSWRDFEVTLPDLPSGLYRVYADITYETGMSDTLTTSVSIPNAPKPTVESFTSEIDPDDAWVEAKPFSGTEPAGSFARRASLKRLRMPATPAPSLAQGGGEDRGGTESLGKVASSLWMDWLAAAEEPLMENRDVRLRFVVRGARNQSISIEPYMGMLGHLILRRVDGSVFTHLHPSGSFSMAARQLFELRAEGKAPLKAASAKEDPICQLPTVAESQAEWIRANPADAENAISFPYAFPKAGQYRLWVQVKVEGEVLTGVFDAEVRASR
ncbi:MAG: hypothetical protein L0Z50_06670, partial [Verrucomicrobiales bacterium]|nr:hypothetical protein [Verrucomicrobiales bacterium]